MKISKVTNYAALRRHFIYAPKHVFIDSLSNSSLIGLLISKSISNKRVFKKNRVFTAFLLSYESEIAFKFSFGMNASIFYH